MRSAGGTVPAQGLERPPTLLHLISSRAPGPGRGDLSIHNDLSQNGYGRADDNDGVVDADDDDDDADGGDDGCGGDEC